MFATNEGRSDRKIRIALGYLLLVIGFGGFVGGDAGLVLGTLGLLPLITGLVGWCPLYSVLGTGTRPPAKQTR